MHAQTVLSVKHSNITRFPPLKYKHDIYKKQGTAAYHGHLKKHLFVGIGLLFFLSQLRGADRLLRLDEETGANVLRQGLKEAEVPANKN